jgi:predicted amidophosphoribosyltransferase
VSVGEASVNGDLHKVCPECGGEFQLAVAECVDCEVPLVFPEDIAARDARELPFSPGLDRLRTAPIRWIRALAADLTRAGIAYAIDRRKVREEGVLGLYVRRRDHEAAAALDEARERIDPLITAGELPQDIREVRPAPDYRVCPECGGEYRLEIERCADCGVELVEPGEEEEEEQIAAELPSPLDSQEEEMALAYFAVPPRHELPASDDLVCLCCTSFSSLTDLSARLDDAGIGHRIERGPYEKLSTRACLYLRPQDCDAAERLWGDPEAADEALATDLRACPACGTSLPLGVSLCPGCDLEFSSPEAGCPHCGAVVIPRSASCPNCGSAIPEA